METALTAATIALAVATITLVGVTWFYAWQTKKLAGSSERATRAVEEQLRYYYEPGLVIGVHHPQGEALFVKVYPANQASVFGVLLSWEGCSAVAGNMEVTPGEDARKALEGLTSQLEKESKQAAPAWTSARIPGDSVGWALLEKRDGGARLLVSWKHVGPGTWSHSWLMAEAGPGNYGFVPEGYPVFEGAEGSAHGH